MARRGSSGLSRIVAIDKPVGMSSHDVVNKVRNVYQERRVGHSGTLDPLASGVLTVCVGPATRLNSYLVDHDKTYEVEIELGAATTTDDKEGQVISQGVMKDEYFDPSFAREKIASLKGARKQIPPAYSAIKVNGQKAYDTARKGKIIDLKPRDIEIYDATFVGICEVISQSGQRVAVWTAKLHVSKGTYIRSIARDLGNSLGCFGHVRALRRLSVGTLDISQCVTLEQLREAPNLAVVDPLQLLRVRYAFISDKKALENGNAIKAEQVALNYPIEGDIFSSECCTSSVYPSKKPPVDNELVAFLSDNRIKGLYRFCECGKIYKPSCIFSLGVERGSGL